jgi:type I restriction enzyme, S subunit
VSKSKKETSGWPTRRLGDVLVRHNEVIHPGERTGEATFVGLEHIEPNSGRRIGSSPIDLGTLTGRKPTFRRGQIVYGYLRPYLNKVWIAEFDGYSSVDQFAFDVRPELADTDFIAAFMRSETFLRRSSIVTTTGQLPRIGTEQIAAVPIELPPVDVQRRVAADLAQKLAEADASIHAAEERHAAAEGLNAAFANEIFDRPPGGSWAGRTLEELVLGSGQYGTSQRSNSEGKGLPVLGMPNIHKGRIRWHNVATVDLPVAEIEKYELKSGDLLFNRTNSAELVGKTAVFDGSRRAVFASYLIRYRANPELADPQFISTYINSRRGRAFIEQHMARAIGQVNISASTMHRMRIPCPPLDTQRRLMELLSRRLAGAEGLVELCQKQLGEIEAMPGALLRATFQGES